MTNTNNHAETTMNIINHSTTETSIDENASNKLMTHLQMLGIKVTFERGLLLAMEFAQEEVEKIIERTCVATSPNLDFLGIRKSNRMPADKAVVAKIMAMSPVEFAIELPYVQEVLLRVGFLETEISEIFEAVAWTSPKYRDGDMILKKPKSTGNHVHWFQPKSTVVKKAIDPSADLDYARLHENVRHELDEISARVSAVQVSLKGLGLTPRQISELVARFTWTGPKYGVHPAAQKNEAPSVA